MKTRFLIIIGVVIALVSILVIDYFDKLSFNPFSNLPYQLQRVLDYCEEKKNGHDMNLIGLHYYNATHYIDNTNCKWDKIENEN